MNYRALFRLRSDIVFTLENGVEYVLDNLAPRLFMGDHDTQMRDGARVSLGYARDEWLSTPQPVYPCLLNSCFCRVVFCCFVSSLKHWSVGW